MVATSESLDVIGLVSGGKDSFFSLLHCIANNHRVIALANLYPPMLSSQSGEPEDLNSFMYQTVGYELIPLYSEALGLPIYRQEIQGSAQSQSKDYHAPSKKYFSGESDMPASQTHEDETESLIPLLRKVMSAHPSANAISSGAILSTYQRTRIESVARRLGLIPISYLWQYPSLPTPSPGGLLDDMAAAGFDVRIVKVASGGLDEELLWGNLMDPVVRKKVQKGVSRFGGSLLGEGGEYETLVIDGMTPFWKGRIELGVGERWIGRGGGGEAWIGLTEATGLVITKENHEPTQGAEWKRRLRIPELWNNEFDKLVKKIPPISSQNANTRKGRKSISRYSAWEATTILIQSSSMLRLYNTTALQAGTTASEQMSAINSRLLEILTEHEVPNADNIIFTTILLRTMADFSPVNDIYGQLFTQPNPPARVTVACGDTMPPGVHVMASFAICLERGDREGLHVQSRSYWAPANIGPYSQAISVPLQPDKLDPRLVYIAGQIPLVPATMDELQADADVKAGTSNSSLALFKRRACLGLQHLWRIGGAMNVDWWVDAVAFIVGDNDIQAKALIAWKCWREVHQLGLWDAEGQEKDGDGCDGLDAWDRKYGGLGSFVDNESKSRSLPDFRRSPKSASCDVPPFFAIQVDGLPRGCDIEWQSLGAAYSDFMTPTVHSLCSHIPISLDDIPSDREMRIKLKEMPEKRQEFGPLDATVYTPQPDLVAGIPAQVIPCKSVWGPGGTELSAGIVVRHMIE